jgi:hypothetical protein
MPALSSRTIAQFLRCTAAALIAFPLGACGFAHVNRDTSERPEVSTGSAARVVMPGEPMPSMEEQGAAGEPTMIGGGSQQADDSDRLRNVPLGPITTLFGYPFWIFGKTLSQKADQAVKERDQQSKPDPKQAERVKTAQDQAQAARLERENEAMREQLRRQTQAPAPRASEPEREASAPREGTPAGSQALRDELAALERSLGQRSPAPGATTTPTANAAAPISTPAPKTAAAVSVPGTTADDRDGDGRPDRWVSGDPAQPTRELLDENRDGRADRVRVYDAQRRLVSAEDDLDFDGKFELFTDYKDGERVRTREDQNGDGEVDGWSFFRSGELVRRESDRDADGLRDLVSMYRGGQLQRQEEDRNADGQPDVIEIFAAGEVAERHEDVDFDGTPDVASFYKAGKLVRKELSSPEMLERWNRKPEER